jgi:hypothetical protein
MRANFEKFAYGVLLVVGIVAADAFLSVVLEKEGIMVRLFYYF